MPKNFNEGIDDLLKLGLDGMPTANTLAAWLCNQAEADVTNFATIVGGQCVRTGTTAIKVVAGLTCVARVIDLGAIDWSAESAGTPRSVVVSTKDPTVAGAKLIAIQDLNGGATVNLATGPGLIVDDLAIQIPYLVSGSVA